MTEVAGVEQRKICWPDPDSVCLEGGCGYCNSGVWKSVEAIEVYAYKVGIKTLEGGGTADYPRSFRWGRDYGWPNTERRTIPGRVE